MNPWGMSETESFELTQLKFMDLQMRHKAIFMFFTEYLQHNITIAFSLVL